MTFERRIKSASEIVSAGQVVQVRVMAVEMDRKRISLSLKRAGDDPWVGASVRWPVHAVVSGLVKRLADFGAFIELAPGVEGLVHISELSDQRVRGVGDVVREGQTVQVKVLEVDEERRRMSLSVKQAGSAAAVESAPASPPPAAPKRNRPLKGGLE
jgi:ribosomal protein S1